MSALNTYKQAFEDVGWFIPPYVTMGFLGNLVTEINVSHQKFNQKDLEVILAKIYSPENLSAMMVERYPITPYILDYKEIISESIEAHFSGLDHVAVAGLMPVIEGAGRRLAEHRLKSQNYLTTVSIKDVFTNLANNCKKQGIGDRDEIASMMDSFINFSDKYLYANSAEYPLDDMTNRNGILHGVYTDEDYGKPVNFYKSIAAIDILCFISAFDAPISWFAPETTTKSEALCNYYMLCKKLRSEKPKLEK